MALISIFLPYLYPFSTIFSPYLYKVIINKVKNIVQRNDIINDIDLAGKI